MSSTFKGPATVVAAALIFAGCGGAGTTSTLPFGVTMQSRTHKASSQYPSLLYASGNNKVAILTYPGGKAVGNITGVAPAGICTDPTDGNVWIVTEEDKGRYGLSSPMVVRPLSQK